MLKLGNTPTMRSSQETLALLKMLVLGNQQVAHAKIKPVADVVKRLREPSKPRPR